MRRVERVGGSRPRPVMMLLLLLMLTGAGGSRNSAAEIGVIVARYRRWRPTAGDRGALRLRTLMADGWRAGADRLTTETLANNWTVSRALARV